MIKYLHEQLNYNVIAFEAPFANLKYVSENRNNLTAEKMLKMGLYYIWRTDDLLDLMNYLKSHPKLQIMGIDCQESNIDSLVISAYTSKIKSENHQLACQYVHLLNRFKILIKSNPFEYSSNNLSENKQVIQQIDSLQKILLNNNLADFDLQFHLQNLKNNCVNYAMFKPFFFKSKPV